MAGGVCCLALLLLLEDVDLERERLPVFLLLLEVERLPLLARELLDFGLEDFERELDDFVAT